MRPMKNVCRINHKITKNCRAFVVTPYSPMGIMIYVGKIFYSRKIIVNIVKIKQFSNQIGWK